MKITRIGHPAIRARDIEKTAAFYAQVLGMPEAFRMYNSDGTVGSVHMYVAPSQFIEIFPNGREESRLGPETIGLNHLCFEVPDARQAFEEMGAKGAPMDTGIKIGHSKCIQFWTHDPDGNRIEIMELPPDCLQMQANQKWNP